MHVFYAPSAEQGHAVLSEEESRHCVKVLRMRPDQELILVDGKGNWFEAVLTEANPKGCVVRITNKRTDYLARPVGLHMAVAPTKQIDRFEWFLEKATECGIDQVTPVYCEHSERTVIKPPRLEKLLLSAMKQSLRAYLPRLNPAVDLKAFLKQAHEGQKLIAHCGEGQKQGFGQVYAPGRDALVLIGPEGDFSADEIALALEQGFSPVGLGPHRLRTETAALAFCVTFNFMNKLI